MTGKDLLNLFNSATTFGILAAIAIGIWFLVLKKDSKPKTSKK